LAVPDRLEDLAEPLAVGLKKIQAQSSAFSFCEALSHMGRRAAPASEILLGLMKTGEPKNRTAIATALAYIAPDDPRVMGEVVPALTQALEQPMFLGPQPFVDALTFIGANAKSAVAKLPKTPQGQFAVSIIAAPEGERKAIVAKVLGDANLREQRYSAIAYLARKPALRSELRPQLERLHGADDLDPFLKKPLERLLKDTQSDFVSIRPF